MFSNVLRDTEQMPSLREPTSHFRSYVAALTSELDRLFPRRSAQRRTTLHHALEFSTWQSLSRLAASERAAVEIAAGWVGSR
jgi:hypothetical protein